MKNALVIGLAAALLTPVAVEARDLNTPRYPTHQQQTGGAGDHAQADKGRGPGDVHNRDQQAKSHRGRKDAEQARDRATHTRQQAEHAKDARERTRANRQEARKHFRMEDSHRAAARRWYATHGNWYRPVPRAVTGRLARDSYLPRGYYRPAPYQLIRVLPRAPHGYDYYAVGSDVVLAAIATGLILEIVR